MLHGVEEIQGFRRFAGAVIRSRRVLCVDIALALVAAFLFALGLVLTWKEQHGFEFVTIPELIERTGFVLP